MSPTDWTVCTPASTVQRTNEPLKSVCVLTAVINLFLLEHMECRLPPSGQGSHRDIYSWSSASSLFESPRLLQSSTSSQICCFCLLNTKALWKLNGNPDSTPACWLSLTKNSHLTRCVGRGEKPWYKGHYLVFQLRVWKSENTTPQIKSITIF